jgi:outer membrane protein OmpA-like peptidoglycan-associated protein
MKKAVIIYIILLLVSPIALFAQVSKGDKMFAVSRYDDAAKFYERAVKKDPNSIHALERLGVSLYRLGRNMEALKHLQDADNRGELSAQGLIVFGDLLKRRNRIDEAKLQYERLLATGEANILASQLIQSCELLKIWQLKPDYWKVENFMEVNTPMSEFGLIPFDQGYLYVSNRNLDHVNRSLDPRGNQPYYDVLYQKEKHHASDAKLFSKQIYSEYHDGPVFYHAPSELMYFSQLDRRASKEGDYRMKIYYAEWDGKRLSKPEEFQYNSDKYSVMHPMISEDGSKLFFSSDMSGGQGGFDLYVCAKQGDGWGKPINLGSGVNTSKDEVFPFYQNEVLYFSSSGHPGYGGLDIFYSEEEDLYEKSTNAMAPLNSPDDDFAIYFVDGENGFFASNRSGGVGEDDIYKFVRLEVLEEDETFISGIFEYQSLPLEGVTLFLMNENDEVIGTVKTDALGKFKFEKLTVDKSYKIRTKEDIPDEAKLYITNKLGKKVMLVDRLNESVFVFEALPFDKYQQMTFYEEEDLSLLRISLFGQIYQKIPGDFSQSIEVWIIDDDGELVAKVRTGPDGKFEFKKLSPDDVYSFKLVGADGEEIKMIITDEYGKLIDSPIFKKGLFVYERLSLEEGFITLLNEDDETIKIKFEENFVISNIYYDYGKWDILPAAQKELNKLLTILKKNAHIGVELSSHTDSRGNDKFNLNLSQKRAQAAKDYIVSQGIPSDRIKASGYGETKLVNHCSNNVECSEEEHAKNRRTEFTIFVIK